MANLIYAIGDVHGCHDQLLVAVAKIKAHACGKAFLAVFLGDYIDRGPKSREVVNLVLGLVTSKDHSGQWRALRGNHECLLAEYLAGDDLLDTWKDNGGDETLES